MTYHFQQCQYEEAYEPEHTYTFTGECEETGRVVSVVLLGPDLFRFNQGEAIQNAFPYIDANHREWMMFGRLGLIEWVRGEEE